MGAFCSIRQSLGIEDLPPCMAFTDAPIALFISWFSLVAGLWLVVAGTWALVMMLPSAVRACNCDLDLTALKQVLWLRTGPAWIASVGFEIATEEKKDVFEISLAGNTRWAEAHRRLLEVENREKHPLRLLVKNDMTGPDPVLEKTHVLER